ncbi:MULTISPECIES: TIGR01777 family oxidoreductase [Mycobacteriaceae]|uniref:Multidrug MFS transporter n=1 Tax=Mycolicibacterium neoaurum VKM Ac-1815D TaxID=700508 RepID=V5XG15_MYCNE|nr:MULTISPECIES: TIGR01777 family oxidoreductase [Mycobacteriaceae]AHC26354.1 multidrug MFS transporter [Mycolicibacterium neoaurum VKM Ac-1815D]AMO06709.1 multidrug MFS transporter [Mycolicibacterium neoaurum]AXK74931.1 TIGR01777 family protein [Mycolicibacterium neoaurum]KJQ48792.1 multidrug MFS transporter [Mycolicibacterium neoaurum]KUM07334.1 epimerase [Mycolicibacterium neoaurum]
MAGQVIAVAGSSGLIGSALTTALRTSDHRVLRLVRTSPAGPDEVFWNPATGQLDIDALAGVDAVVNLCGVGVGDKRWSGSFKQSLRDSRIGPTEVLAAAVADAGVPLLVNASAVGYYGDTRDRVVDETAPCGTGFLAQLCADWEASTAVAEDAGARVVLLRTGLVLSPAGGMLNRLRPIFGLGLGARLGNGRQYFPWISLEDEIRAIRFALTDEQLAGPVNLTGPAPVTNGEFTAALGRALNRPTPMIVPGFALRAALGEFADEGLLAGQRAIPAALERAGFVFHHNTVGAALSYVTAGVPPA